MLHLYCIVPAGRGVPEHRTGLEGRRPLVVEAGALAVWATEHDRAVPASVDALRTHNEVVVSAMDTQVTPVPIRFGQTAGDRTAAAELLADTPERWLELLAGFAGRAEYGLRALVDEADAEQDVHAASSMSGTEYMAGLARRNARSAERRARGEQIVDRVEQRAGVLADDVRVEHFPSGPVLLSVAHLVAWTAADAYHGAMRELRESSADARLLLTGPWPPYSFVE